MLNCTLWTDSKIYRMSEKHFCKRYQKYQIILKFPLVWVILSPIDIKCGISNEVDWWLIRKPQCAFCILPGQLLFPWSFDLLYRYVGWIGWQMYRCQPFRRRQNSQTSLYPLWILFVAPISFIYWPHVIKRFVALYTCRSVYFDVMPSTHKTVS